MVAQIQHDFTVKCLDADGRSKDGTVDATTLPQVALCTQKYASEYFVEKKTQRNELPLYKHPGKELLEKKKHVEDLQKRHSNFVARSACTGGAAAGFLASGIILAVLVHPAFAALIAGAVIGAVILGINTTVNGVYSSNLNLAIAELNILVEKLNADNTAILKDAALFFRGDLFKKMLSDLDAKIGNSEISDECKVIEELDGLRMVRANLLEVDACAEALLPRKKSQKISTDATAEARVVSFTQGDMQSTAPPLVYVRVEQENVVNNK
jgi:hypothetical protein